jgi:DNA repair protein RadC
MSHSKKIKDIDKVDRPREKLRGRGITALSDNEVIQLLIGSGIQGADVRQLSTEIVDILEKGTDSVTLEKLKELKGVSTAKASKLLAAIEIADRFARDDMRRIKESKDVLPLLSDIRDKKREYFIAITLDGAGRVINKRTISVGTLDASLIHPREVFADAVEDRAASIIVAHNHPSGSLEPSKENEKITKRLKKAGEVLGISVMDHIIVSGTEWSSVKVN